MNSRMLIFINWVTLNYGL